MVCRMEVPGEGCRIVDHGQRLRPLHSICAVVGLLAGSRVLASAGLMDGSGPGGCGDCRRLDNSGNLYSLVLWILDARERSSSSHLFYHPVDPLGLKLWESTRLWSHLTIIQQSHLTTVL